MTKATLLCLFGRVGGCRVALAGVSVCAAPNLLLLGRTDNYLDLRGCAMAGKLPVEIPAYGDHHQPRVVC